MVLNFQQLDMVWPKLQEPMERETTALGSGQFIIQNEDALRESGCPSGLSARLSAHTVDIRRSPTVLPDANDVVIDEPHGPGYCCVRTDCEPVKKMLGPPFQVIDL